MKRSLNLLLILFLCLSFFTPKIVYASVKLNKTKATLEVDATLKLKISGTESTVKWSSSKKSVATVNSSGTITAKAEGQATITASVSSKKYFCSVTVVDNNKVEPVSSVKTLKDLETYLNKTYSSVKTDMGTMKMTHEVMDNFADYLPYDINISTTWSGIEPFDIEYSTDYSKEEKANTKAALAKVQKSIYNDTIKFFPNKKIEGGFLISWYEYPNLKVGYKSIRFLSWQNFETSGYMMDYDSSKLSDFIWVPEYDDYNFIE